MWTKAVNSIVLPKEITAFERAYLARMNKVGLLFFALHLPVFVAVAFFNDTGPLSALILTGFALAGPVLAYLTLENPRAISIVYGFTAMLTGGLLVHFGQGPLQIEMHFYFFALLAMLAVYGNPAVILVAAATVAAHHLVLWLLVPASVFNYSAPVWVVAVHAGFVVLESVATCYIARSFFDNVIGLERIVRQRTAELDARTREMRLVLDNVDQGFVTLDPRGVMFAERSAIVETWLGAARENESFADYLRRTSVLAADMFEAGWQQVADGFLPMGVALDQLPAELTLGERSLRLAYTPIMAGDELSQALVVISDVTSLLEKQRLEAEQREVLQLFECVMKDKSGFLEFIDESRRYVLAIADDSLSEGQALSRALHTLKGNTAIFGLHSTSELCHALESALLENGARPTFEQRTTLRLSFERLCGKLETLLGERRERTLEIDDQDYEALLSAVLRGENSERLARRIRDFKLEPTARRLRRIAEQAERIAERLGKTPLEVKVVDHALRFDAQHWASFWSAFVHVIRNAVDHGLEQSSEREQLGKPQQGVLTLSTRLEGAELVVEIADDGRGIDWELLAARSAAAGLPHASDHDLTEALFVDGITTARVVTEISGRGVGLGAVRHECLARGGSIEVSSTRGRGTRLICRFPSSQMTGQGLVSAA